MSLNLYKVTFVAGGGSGSIRVKAKNKNLAWGYAKQYGIPSKVEVVHSRLWHLVWVVLFGLGFYGAQML